MDTTKQRLDALLAPFLSIGPEDWRTLQMALATDVSYYGAFWRRRIDELRKVAEAEIKFRHHVATAVDVGVGNGIIPLEHNGAPHIAIVRAETKTRE